MSPSLRVEFELPKLLPFGNNAVNTLRSPLEHLPTVNIASVTAADVCRGSTSERPSGPGGVHRRADPFTERVGLLHVNGEILNPERIGDAERVKQSHRGLSAGAAAARQRHQAHSKSRPNYGQMRGSSLCLRTKPEVTQLVFKGSSHSRGCREGGPWEGEVTSWL
ncbi:hypothetical protein EYF80_035147 [Liparis tanakae]|uniref:Uncharacterized protein n=1 Tax=Liparis tanakae TaxID=230148 RepID=A0A4Z2GNA1_9TELE|nr:hypothetical protein EYF80_035147 [Liparis tanakae]